MKSFKTLDTLHAGLSIAYEDECLLALNKPSGMPSAPLRADEPNTALTLAVQYLPELRTVTGYKAIEYGLVHRLDTGTSGLLIIAKSQASFARLQSLWKTRKVLKYYRALVLPCRDAPPVPHLPFQISWPIAHSARSSKKQIAVLPHQKQALKQIRGKIREAMTHIMSIQKTDPPHLSTKASLWDLTLRLETGVMHQIRCHLATQGWPILGDLLYQGAPSKRLWLHAWKLEFPSKNGDWIRLEAPLPADWDQAEQNLTE